MLVSLPVHGGHEDDLLLLVVEEVLGGYSLQMVLDRSVWSLDLLRLLVLVAAFVLLKAGRCPPETGGRLQDLFRFLALAVFVRGTTAILLARLCAGLLGRGESFVSKPMRSSHSLFSARSRVERSTSTRLSRLKTFRHFNFMQISISWKRL